MMEDKKSVVLYDKEGRAYLKIIREESPVEKRINDFKEDLLDDGKRNFSNRKRRVKKKKRVGE